MRGDLAVALGDLRIAIYDLRIAGRAAFRRRLLVFEPFWPLGGPYGEPAEPISRMLVACSAMPAPCRTDPLQS